LLVVFSVWTGSRVGDVECKQESRDQLVFRHSVSLEELAKELAEAKAEIKTLKADYMRVYGLEEEHWLDDVKEANNDTRSN